MIWQIKNTALNLPGYINKTKIVAYSSHQTKTKPMTIRHTQKPLVASLQHSCIGGGTLALFPGLNFHLQF